MGQKRKFLEPDPKVGRASSQAVGTTAIDTPGMIVAPDGRITLDNRTKECGCGALTGLFQSFTQVTMAREDASPTFSWPTGLSGVMRSSLDLPF